MRRAAFSSAPAWPASPRITAPALTARWDASRSIADGRIAIYGDACRDGQRHRHRARQSRRSTSRRDRGRSHRWRRSTATTRSGWSRPAILHDGPRRPRTQRRKIRAGCRRSAPRPPRRSARMSGRMPRPRRRASMFRFGLWPAALELWRIAPADPRAKEWYEGALEGRTAHHVGPVRR